MVTALMRTVNYIPGICQRANQIKDKAGAPVDVKSLMAIEKVIKQKFTLPFIVHSCSPSINGDSNALAFVTWCLIG